MAKKIDALQKFEKNDTHLRHLQTVYLKEHGFELDEIAEWTGYTKATIKLYVKKFKDLIEEAKKTFYHITMKMKESLIKGKQLVYLFKFKEENIGIISKVGTTSRLPQRRLKEEINYYNKHGLNVKDAEICSVIDCGDLPAEGAESFARAHYIKKNPKAFHKNDRFFGMDISTKDFNKVIDNYLNEKTA